MNHPKTSVPTVLPFEMRKQNIADLLEKTLELKRQTGEDKLFKTMLEVTRRFYEEEMKPAANLQRLDRAYLEKVRKALEKVEHQR